MFEVQYERGGGQGLYRGKILYTMYVYVNIEVVVAGGMRGFRL